MQLPCNSPPASCADSVAVYTFSRNMSRAAPLTRDHSTAIAGLRKSVAGDDTALYNASCWPCATPPRSPDAKLILLHLFNAPQRSTYGLSKALLGRGCPPFLYDLRDSDYGILITHGSV